jgi:hypothetical protein
MEKRPEKAFFFISEKQFIKSTENKQSKRLTLQAETVKCEYTFRE